MEPAFTPDSVCPRIDATYRFGGVLFKEICYPSNYRMRPHAHRQAQLIFSLQGTVEEVWKRQTLLRTPSTLMFLPVDEPHSNRFHGVKTLQIELDLPWIERVQQFSPLSKNPVACANPLLTCLAARLYREIHSRDNSTPLML